MKNAEQTAMAEIDPCPFLTPTSFVTILKIKSAPEPICCVLKNRRVPKYRDSWSVKKLKYRVTILTSERHKIEKIKKNIK